MAEPLHAKYSGNKVAGSSMEGTTSRRKLPQAAGTDKGNTVSHSDLIEEPKKLQYSYENAFSIGYDRSLFNSLASPPQTKTCHRCGLFGSLRCSRCRQINYCSVDCQKEDWPSHRVVCEPVKQNSSNNNGGKIPAKTETGLYLKGNSTSVDSLKTEEQCKKIMLSDLQSLGLKKAMEVQGTVTEFRSPSEFYMQMSSPEVLDQISKLSVKLQDCYANTVIQEHYVAIKGEVCVARNSLDQMWSRALVKDVDTSQKKAQVLYIDYGKEENIPLSWIKALCKDIELLPPCAIKCSFANYEPKQRGWNEGDDIFSSQLVGKTCSVIVVDILQEEMMSRFAVDVVRPNFYKLPLEMGSDLTPGSSTEGTDSPKVSENHSLERKEKTPEDKDPLCYGKSVAEYVSVCIGDTFSGVVSHIQNPDDFFCQQMRNGCHLAELQLCLEEHCNKLPSNPDFRPALGDLCCAQFTGKSESTALNLSV